jgi:hypothetical protein
MDKYTQVPIVTGDGYEFTSRGGEHKWYKEGKLHREDGPAVECDNGDCKWYKEGKLHRVDGPARISATGYREWFLNGQPHREDGPAVYRLPQKGELPFNTGEVWYLNGRTIKESHYNYMSECALEELPRFLNTPLAPLIRKRLRNT